MKYLVMGWIDQTKLTSLPRGEVDRLVADAYAWVDDLKRRGQFVLSAQLQPVQNATTIRVQDGKPTVTDGPYAETKEQLGGFSVIEARDLNEAIQAASRAAAAGIGSFEVRPIDNLLFNNSR